MCQKFRAFFNELMTFLEDDLSIITGPYEDLLTLDEIIDQELVLFVSLNVNRNSRAVTALGRILLQNLQLMVGKRYQNERSAAAKADLLSASPWTSLLLLLIRTSLRFYRPPVAPTRLFCFRFSPSPSCLVSAGAFVMTSHPRLIPSC